MCVCVRVCVCVCVCVCVMYTHMTLCTLTHTHAHTHTHTHGGMLGILSILACVHTCLHTGVYAHAYREEPRACSGCERGERRACVCPPAVPAALGGLGVDDAQRTRPAAGARIHATCSPVGRAQPHSHTQLIRSNLHHPPSPGACCGCGLCARKACRRTGRALCLKLRTSALRGNCAPALGHAQRAAPARRSARPAARMAWSRVGRVRATA